MDGDQLPDEPNHFAQPVRATRTLDSTSYTLCGDPAWRSRTTERTHVTCGDCLRIMHHDQRLLAVGGPTPGADFTLPDELFHRPIDRIIIDKQHEILGEAFKMGSLTHDCGTGEVTLTFADVNQLEIIYKDQVQR